MFSRPAERQLWARNGRKARHPWQPSSPFLSLCDDVAKAATKADEAADAAKAVAGSSDEVAQAGAKALTA